jgi:hypothetical protein
MCVYHVGQQTCTYDYYLQMFQTAINVVVGGGVLNKNVMLCNMKQGRHCMQVFFYEK